MIEFLSKIAPIAISVGLTGWVYQTLNSVIKSLREEIQQLSKDIDTLKVDITKEREEKNKWYRKYHKLLNIIKKNGECKHGCPVASALDVHLIEEGEQ